MNNPLKSLRWHTVRRRNMLALECVRVTDNSLKSKLYRATLNGRYAEAAAMVNRIDAMLEAGT